MKRPKHTEETKAVRVFTDREEPRQAFWKQYQAVVADISNPDDEIHVLHYYGVGGIGKTSLLKKLMEEMDQCLSAPWYTLYNFESATDLLTILKSLKSSLEKKYKFNFTLLNIGLYIYAQKCGEDAVAIEKKSLLDSHPLWQQIFNVADNIPVADVVARAFTTFDSLYAYAGTKSLLNKHKGRMHQLMDLDAAQVYRELPKLFAEDLTHTMADAKKPLVIFLDTYERLVNEMVSVGEPLMEDQWLRGLNGPIQSVPHVLWVISGREKLKWDRFDADWATTIEAHRLGNLSQQDSIAFLQGAGVSDTGLAQRLYQLSNGTPVYLDLCVEIYETLQTKSEVMDISRFGHNHIELIERFMRYMDDTQKTLAYIAACMRQWDDEAFATIAKALSVWNPITYEKFKGYSFVDDLANDSYIIHQTVGDVLAQHCANSLKQEIATAMMAYFSARIKEQGNFSDTYTFALLAVARAGLLLYTEREQLREFCISNVESPLHKLIDYGKFNEVDAVLHPLLTEAEKCKEDYLYITILRWNAVYLIAKGQYVDAQIAAQEALEISRRILGADHLDTLQIMSNLASALGHLGQHEQALALQQEVLKKRRRILGEDHLQTLETLHSLASSHNALKQREAALDLMKQVLEARRRLLGVDHPDTLGAMNSLAVSLHSLEKFEEALTLLEELLEKRQQILGEDHPHTLSTMNNLAATLKALKRYDAALFWYERTLEKCRRILGESHPNTLHAMNNLASILRDLERGKEAQVLMEEIERRRNIDSAN